METLRPKRTSLDSYSTELASSPTPVRHETKPAAPGRASSGLKEAKTTQTRAPYSFPVSNNRAFSDRFRAREASSMISSGTS